MCGRIYIAEVADIEREFHVGRDNQPMIWVARYNVAPQQGNPRNYIPVIRHDEDNKLQLLPMQWWLLPGWAKEPTIKHATFNARVESVRGKASFRESFKRRRCLIPVAGWHEWQELPTGNLPWHLHSAQGGQLALAGLWDRWERDGRVIESCSIIIGPANKAFEPIHDRMPFIIPNTRQNAWLDRGEVDPDRVMSMLQTNPEDSVKWHRVGRRINNARIDEAELILPLPAGEDDVPEAAPVQPPDPNYPLF